ncbi:MAG: CRISPR-associated endonuclease Cas3'', partial [Planctomycetaceae bacterium]|nr:CRISPR-associated endonuclease Cas3'' [Planctomycetaceae bacterium]
PGDTIVLPVDAGGLDVFGHKPDASPMDIGDIAHLQTRNQAILRFTNSSLYSTATREAAELLSQLCDEPEADFDLREVSDALREAAEHSNIPYLAEIVERLSQRPTISRHPFRGLIFRGSKRAPSQKWKPVETFTTEDDSASHAHPATISAHSKGVAERVEHYALACGLDSEIARDMKLAGYLHDLGKADGRFQTLLQGGRPVTFGEPLAKSLAAPITREQAEIVRSRSGLPTGFRHELVSIRLIESAPELLGEARDPEVILHLIGAHHGRCRPFAPIVKDETPQEVHYCYDSLDLRCSSATGLERVDSGVAERFWNLVNCHGWWGLAYLEAIFRLADHRQSEEEQSGSSKEFPQHAEAWK